MPALAAGNAALGGSNLLPQAKEKDQAMDTLEHRTRLNPGLESKPLLRHWTLLQDYHGYVLSSTVKSRPQLLNSLPVHGASSQRPSRPSLQP